MGLRTGIQWTDATWNPMTGCTKITKGCLADFVAFAGALGARAEDNKIVEARSKAGVRLWIGWVLTPAAGLEGLEAAM